MRNLILSAALVSASLFGMTAQAAEPLEAGRAEQRRSGCSARQDRSGRAVLVRLPALLRV